MINAVDKYVVYDDVAYIKGGWVNRNYVLINGKASLFTIPLENSSSFRNINEIRITSDAIAVKKLVKALELSYAKAPYRAEVLPMIEDLLHGNTDIATLNLEGILRINQYLGIDTDIILSSKLEKRNDLKAQEKVIHINKLLNADRYINAIGGMKLYDRSAFEAAGIELKFLKMDAIEYQQFREPFVPDLSIIDVLMFNGRAGTRELLDKYTLI